MKTLHTLIALVAAAATLSLGAIGPAQAQADLVCLSEVQIQSAIEAGQIKSWPKIKKLAGISGQYQELSNVEVCLVDGIPYYQVNVVSPSGEVTRLVINALDGTI
jgi:hypothetical protein